MTIVGALPYDLTDGTTAVGAQVLADINKVRNDVNSNAAANGANSDITGLTALTSAAKLIISPATACSFSANKGTTNQAIVSQVETTVTFPTEAFDIGSKFASNTWTPLAGKCRVGGQISFTGTADTSVTIGIKKNGTLIRRTGGKLLTAVSLGTGACSVQIWILDAPTGATTYTLSVFAEDAVTVIADDPITAGILTTWFEGTMI